MTISNSSTLQGRRVNRLPCFCLGSGPVRLFVVFGFRVLLCFSGPRGKIRISDRGMCTSSLRFCVVVWFLPPVVFVQFQQRFERVSVPALYVLRSVFRTEPLSLFGGTPRKKMMEWYENLESPMDQVHHGDDLEVYHVRAVPLVMVSWWFWIQELTSASFLRRWLMVDKAQNALPRLCWKMHRVVVSGPMAGDLHRSRWKVRMMNSSSLRMTLWSQA